MRTVIEEIKPKYFYAFNETNVECVAEYTQYYKDCGNAHSQAELDPHNYCVVYVKNGSAVNNGFRGPYFINMSAEAFISKVFNI